MRRLWITAGVIFVLDQATKWFVLNVLNLADALYYAVLPPFLQFRMAWNDGVNFGLLSNESSFSRWALVLLALVIAGWVLLWARKERRNPQVAICSGLLIGGAAGNVVDRVMYGAVADFLNMGFPGFDNPYSFNIADVAIFLGAVGLVIFSGRGKTPVTRRKS